MIHAQDHAHGNQNDLTLNVKKCIFLVRLWEVILNEASYKKSEMEVLGRSINQNNFLIKYSIFDTSA